ncbi:hypothetical protein V6Z90_002619 [Aspergillus fumigatus]|nr:hypothetical protein CNMCM8714_002769 [Aspergillus fumigatus]KAH1525470.1 hypothetical protein KXX18_004115 [Aspergillus fumigatus]KAH2890855.1 hypothetical protein KXV75_003807 [Aspergillus fumigatus]
MASKSNTILVLGATGPAGICLLRELISSSYHVVVYARNPAKIPNDIASQGLLTVTKGEMNDHESLEKTMSPCFAVLSLLGPSIDHKDIDPSIYAGYYRDAVFPAMRKLGIRRIIAMGTISISHRDDHFTIFQPMVHVFMRFFAKAIYSNMQNVAATFQKAGQGLDWTVFRIARIVGECDELSWRSDGDACQVYAGRVGGKGWTTSITRAELARWIVCNIESSEWYQAMPALSKLSG